MALLAALPSPDQNTIGPFRIYGLIIGVAVAVAVWLSERRFRARGYPSGSVVDNALWVILAGLVGARVYHVISDYQLFTDRPLRAFAIWSGGLSIWGAVLGGGIAAVVIARRHGVNPLDVLDVVAPAVVLAQAIGRWGNYFNQELFGNPTGLPWGLRIDLAHRPEGYEASATFHPVFLYESLYCLAIFGALLAAERYATLRRGQTVALYVVLYTFGRFWLENLRIDSANELAGLRVNAWVSLGVCIASVVWFLWLGRHEPRQPPAASAAAQSEPTVAP